MVPMLQIPGKEDKNLNFGYANRVITTSRQEATQETILRILRYTEGMLQMHSETKLTGS